MPSQPNGRAAEAIAFFLPQFHPIPENDRWWGAGFTEWRNVASARPWFFRQAQPRLPKDLGFYDLRLTDVRLQQIELARQAGLSAFCYYDYWFMGTRLLEKPLEQLLKHAELDFPFMLCWANESWTRAWDGYSSDVLMEQSYSLDDDRAHIRSLLPALCDARYYRVEDCPAFAVYRPTDIPNLKETTNIWREEASRAGLPGLHLIAVQRQRDEHIDAAAMGCDAVLQFRPDWNNLGPWRRPLSARVHHALRRQPWRGHAGRVYDYETVVDLALKRPPSQGQPTYECVMPSWDNTPRRHRDATVVAGGTPRAYEAWLTEEIRRAPGGLVFINAWNEWAEGAFLEPDLAYGHGWINATARALTAGNLQAR